MDTRAQSSSSFKRDTARLAKRSRQELLGSPMPTTGAVNQGHNADTIVPSGSHVNGEGAGLTSKIDEESGHNAGRSKRRRLCSGVERDLPYTRADGPSNDQRGKDLPPGSPKQACLAKSRLKSMPNDTTLCRTACTISILGEEMGRLLEQGQASESFTIGDGGRSSWDFKSIAEAMDVDQRLRAIVISWAEKQNFDASVVEYTFLSQVKGKGRA